MNDFGYCVLGELYQRNMLEWKEVTQKKIKENIAGLEEIQREAMHENDAERYLELGKAVYNLNQMLNLL